MACRWSVDIVDYVLGRPQGRIFPVKQIVKIKNYVKLLKCIYCFAWLASGKCVW